MLGLTHNIMHLLVLLHVQFLYSEITGHLTVTKSLFLRFLIVF